MNKNKNKKAPRILVLIIIAFYLLSQVSVPRFRMMLRFLLRPPYEFGKIRFLLETAPLELLLLAILLFFFIVIVVSILKSITGSSRGRSTGVTPGRETNIRKTAGTAGYGKPVKGMNYGKASGAKAGGRKADTSGETDTIEFAFHRSMRTGKDKYLSQLDDYLRSGLIDRKGYDELYKKYSNMNIPDDYM